MFRWRRVTAVAVVSLIHQQRLGRSVMAQSQASVTELVLGGHVLEAVEAAEQQSVDAVLAQMSYELMDQHAAQLDGFFDRWYRDAGSLGRKIDIEHAPRARRGTALCHLEGVADRAIDMYLDAQRLLADRLRLNLAEISMLASVPEATMPASQVEQILVHQEVLAKLRFNFTCSDRD